MAASITLRLGSGPTPIDLEGAALITPQRISATPRRPPKFTRQIHFTRPRPTNRDAKLSSLIISHSSLPAPAQPSPMPSEPRSTLLPDYQRHWPAYFDAIAGQPPRDTCLRALAACAEGVRLLDENFIAYDLACGEGRDTRAILASDARWRVVAMDSSKEGLARLAKSLGADASRVRVLETSLEAVADVYQRDLTLPRHACLINASFALPFCHEDHFPMLWNWIESTLAGDTIRPAGLFAGQFFAHRDEWATVNPRRHVTRDQLLALLKGWHIIHLEEVEKEGSDAMGGTKHHHLFHVVARR
jgi:hypothetical protein